MNWDDLRIIAAVQEEGTFAGAAHRLRIDETTVARRLGRIERALGLRLFEAADGVRRPTREGEAVLAHVQAMTRHVADIGRVGAGAPGPVGRFRLATTNTLAETMLAPRAAEFLAPNPGLALQFLTANTNVNFSRWEADFAIRLAKPARGDFAISKLGDILFCLIEPASAEPAPVVCAYSPELELTPETRFLQARGLQAAARCVSDNPRIIRNLVRSRRAVGVLPEYLAGEFQGDRRFKVTPLPKRRDTWLLVQNHLKRDPAARLVVDWVRESFRLALG